MKRMADDSQEWVKVEVPVNLAKALDEADEILLIGIRDDADDQRHVVLGGYGLKLGNVNDYMWGMANVLKQQLDQAVFNVTQTKGVINLLQTRALELENQINDYMSEVKDDAEPDKVLHDVVGLLGSCMGQMRALHGVKFDEDDVFSGPNVEELRDEVDGADAAGAEPADDAGPESDGSGGGSAGDTPVQ